MSENSFIVYISGGRGDAIGVMRPSQSRANLGIAAEPLGDGAKWGEAERVGA